MGVARLLIPQMLLFDHIWTIGLHFETNITGAQTEGQSHTVSWCFCAKQQAQNPGHASQTGQEEENRWSKRCQNRWRMTGGHDLGPATEKGVQYWSERGPVETCTHCGGAVKVMACIED